MVEAIPVPGKIRGFGALDTNYRQLYIIRIPVGLFPLDEGAASTFSPRHYFPIPARQERELKISCRKFLDRRTANRQGYSFKQGALTE